MNDREHERQRRIGLNEAVFRELNENISRIQEQFSRSRSDLELVCECGFAQCADRITVTRDDYEELRSDPRSFAIVPGHEIADVEDVVARRQGYDVVAKHEGVPTHLATETDPRA